MSLIHQLLSFILVNGVDKQKFNIVDEFISHIIRALCCNFIYGKNMSKLFCSFNLHSWGIKITKFDTVY
jgi:hypothetical protein